MGSEKILSIVLYGLIGLCVLYYVAHFIVANYRGYKNRQQPVQTDHAVVRHKHTEGTLVNQGRSSGDVFFITFHTDFGEIVKLYMGYENFYIIHEGDAGQLTWQGERFCSFVPDEKKE